MNQIPEIFIVVMIIAGALAGNSAYLFLLHRIVKKKVSGYLGGKPNTSDGSFPLSPHMRATLRTKRRPLSGAEWGSEVWLDIDLDPKLPMFPFQATVDDPSQKELNLPKFVEKPFQRFLKRVRLTGNQGAFWAQMDQITRRWMDQATFHIGGRRISFMVYDSRKAGWNGLTNLSLEIDRACSKVNRLAERLIAPDPTGNLAAILAEDTDKIARRTALRAWLDANQPTSSLPASLETYNYSRHLEYWLFVLDCGGALPAMIKANLFEHKDKELHELFLSVLGRMAPDRRLATGIEALTAPQIAGRVADLLKHHQSGRLAAGLVSAYRLGKDPHLFDIMLGMEDARIVGLMIEILENGHRNLLLRAADYLARFGGHSALAPMVNSRKRAILNARRPYDQALDHLRLRLGINGEHAGSVTLVQPEPQQGALQIPPDNGGLSITGAPSAPSETESHHV